MAKKTRHRIKDQAARMLARCDRIQEDLMAIHLMANGQSEWIDEKLPLLVAMTEQYEETLRRFADRL